VFCNHNLRNNNQELDAEEEGRTYRVHDRWSATQCNDTTGDPETSIIPCSIALPIAPNN
jgi:hypothetical protein